MFYFTCNHGLTDRRQLCCNGLYLRSLFQSLSSIYVMMLLREEVTCYVSRTYRVPPSRQESVKRFGAAAIHETGQHGDWRSISLHGPLSQSPLGAIRSIRAVLFRAPSKTLRVRFRHPNSSEQSDLTPSKHSEKGRLRPPAQWVRSSSAKRKV